MNKKQANNIIGIDIGGTKIKGVLWGGKKVLKFVETDTPKNLADFKTALNRIAAYLGAENLVAVGAAGIVEGKKIARSPNISYLQNFNFFGNSGLNFKIKALDNDARCFARAEYVLGNGRGLKRAFFITLGTGVGRAAGKNGKILKVKKFEYPEPWEKEYQKIRDLKDDEKLAKFVGEKIKKLAEPYRPQAIIIGGGVAERKTVFEKLKKKVDIPLKKPMIKRGGAAIGVAMMVVKHEA